MGEVKILSVAKRLGAWLRLGIASGLVAGSLMVSAQPEPSVASAAASAAVPPSAAARLPLTPADILVLASQDERFVDRIQRQLRRPDPAIELLESLGLLQAPVEEKLRAFGADTLADLPVARLESLDRHWKFDARRFSQWQAQAQRKLRPLDEAAAQVARRRDVWEATRASAVLDQLPPRMLNRVEALLNALDQLKADLSVPLARQIELSQRANALASQIDTGSAEVEDAIASIDRRLLARDTPPLWAALGGSLHPLVDDNFSRGMEIESQFARAYAAAAPFNRSVLLVLQPTLLVLILLARHRARRLGGVGARKETEVLNRPLSAWLLLSMMAVLVLEPEAPLLAHQVAMLVALVPLLRLLPTQPLGRLGRWPYAVISLYVLDGLGMVPSTVGTGFRLIHLGVALVALALVLALPLRARRQAEPPPRWAQAAAWAAAALLTSAVLLNVGGNTSLADALVSGLVESTFFGLLLFATVNVAKALVRALLDDASVRRLPLLQRHGAQMSALVSRLLTWSAAAGWAVYAMNAFRIMRPVLAAVTDILTRNVEVGEISVSLGDVLVFALAVLIAWWVARLVRQLLGEQLSARPSLPRGVASSVASLSYYVILMVGFLVALSAAGFKVSQLALVFGALGVGIGFGLQNIVNNFVSGLVLMFERPLRPGDVVEVAGVSGRVQSIGMRATTIRTFDGAEVVVPNGSLLSNSLVNWTLVDHSRRIDIEVGVVYGSDPARVVDLLESAARDTPGIAEQPAPSAVLKGYGDSSLDFVLRAWTMDYDSWVSIRSSMLMRIVAALEAQGIQIPFKQVDLNVRTVSEEAAEVLRPRAPAAGP